MNNAAKMVLKTFKQFSMAVKRPGQAARVGLSELKMRLGIPTLRSVEFQVTHKCNLRCKFCYAEDIMYAEDRKPTMPLQDFQRIISECHDLGMMHVNVTGGEPLTRKDIFELVDSIPKNVVVSLVTNSSLLTKDKIDALARAGLSTIQMSYGSNYKHFNRDLARYCIEKGISVTLSIVNIMAERPANELAMAMAREDSFNVLFNYPMRYNNEGVDSEFYWRHRYDPIVREDNLFWSGMDRCPAGIHKIYITNDGEIMPCDRIHKPYGNAYKSSIKEVWRSMYDKYRNHESFCLLETNIKQWALNNSLSGRSYPLERMGTAEDPFNVLKGVPSSFKV